MALHGGYRPGSGRKPSAATLALRKLQESKVKDVEYAYRLFVEWMRDTKRDDEFRADCAREVMNRLWGKPTTIIEADVTEHSGQASDYSDAELETIIRRGSAIPRSQRGQSRRRTAGASARARKAH